MAKWTFEPGHTAAEFVARHMMVTFVRGSIQDAHGTLQYDADNPTGTSVPWRWMRASCGVATKTATAISKPPCWFR